MLPKALYIQYKDLFIDFGISGFWEDSMEWEF